MSAAPQIDNDVEHRRAPRERVMMSAKLVFSQGSVSVTCVATNISTTGARLSVSEDVVLGQTMRLTIPQREIDMPVRMVWRRGKVVAVAFEPNPPAARPTADLPPWRGLEVENRELRALVARLESRVKQLEEGY